MTIRDQRPKLPGRGSSPVTIDAAGLRQLKQIMAGKEIVFTISIGLGKAQTEWLGCDLSRQYVTINADYTT